jgi:hypothetical protein
MAYSVSKLATLTKQVPPSGMRLSRIIVKESAKTPNLQESVGLFVPLMSNSVVQAAMNSDTILDGIRGYLEGIQNQCIRASIVAGKPVDDSVLCLDSIAEWIISNEETSIRLSEESVGRWFDTVALTHIQSQLMIQRNLNVEQSLEIAKNYRKHYCNAAKKASTFAWATADLKAKVVATATYVADKLNEDDVFGMKVLSKLAEFEIASNSTDGL